MAFGVAKDSVSLNDIKSRVTEIDILSFYLNIKELPCVINSPFREDNRPSFGIYLSNKSQRVYYKDYATNDSGGLFDLLGKLWKCDYRKVLENINKDINKIDKGTIRLNTKSSVTIRSSNEHYSTSDLQCKIREWRDYDIEYWSQYGISLKWLKYADVYPISHKIIIKNQHKYVFKADKLAYAYVERKEGKVSLKIYSPYNKKYKWCSNTDRSVWGLWTKIPKYGDNLIISSSVKDCLNIMCNLGIPSICLQGEGFLPKPHIMNQLKERYKNIIIFFDNDFENPNNPGHTDALKICEEYNLKMVEIPSEFKSKDPSDLYKNYGKEKYLEIMKSILKDKLWKKNGEV